MLQRVTQDVSAWTDPMDAVVGETIAKSFLLAVAKRGDRPALREKYLGIWRTISWREWEQICKEIAYALNALGLQSGEVVSILANTVPEWVYADLGALCAGGVTSGIYPTDSAQQVEYLIKDSRTTVIFVEDDEQLDKVLMVRERCPSLKKIIVFDMEGLSDLSDPMVLSLAAMRELGRNHISGREGLWQQMIDSRGPGDMAILVYTSGTTGPPKGVMHSHYALTEQMRHANKIYRSTEADQRLLFLPLCHVAERLYGCYAAMAAGPVMNFAESPETVPDNIREVQPTAFLAVPRIWEKFYSSTIIAINEAMFIEQWLYRKAINIGFRMADHRVAGTAPSTPLKLANLAAYYLVLKNIRKLLGIDKARILLTGAAPIAPDLIKWYLALGIDMYEIYGQTESCGFATVMTPEKIKLGTVGKPLPWCEVRIAETGEILIRSDYLMMGYLHHPELTAATIDAEGWLHTGDVGAIDEEGYVKVTDRIKDIIITAGGKNITPSEIENQLKFSPYITDAIVIGDRRPYLTCLVMIDKENVEKFAQARELSYTNYRSLCQLKEVRDLIWSEIEAVNGKVARVETLKRFWLIEHELTPEDDELTPTMKLKRALVNRKYATEIEAMYGGSS